MLWTWIGRSAGHLVLTAMLALLPPATAKAQSAAELDALNKQIVQLYGQGKYAEAILLAEKLLAARERVLGMEHPLTLTSVNNLALLYEVQGRYGEAEPLYRRALEASERVLSKEHPATLTYINNLVALYRAQGRYGEAEALGRRDRGLGK